MSYSGIFLKINADQVEFFELYLAEGWQYSDVISDASMDLKPIEIALISTEDDLLTYICLLRRKNNRVAVRKWKFDFIDIKKLSNGIKISGLVDSLSKNIQRHFNAVTQHEYVRIPNGTWNGVLKYFESEYPKYYRYITDLEELRSLRSRKYTRAGAEIYAQEKDAVNLILRFAGMEKESAILKDWIPPTDSKAPFLKGLTTAKLLEDPMIIHDSLTFGDWEMGEHDQVGTITFANREERVTIWNVNRHPVEETLGVDLLYYNHRYDSYVMVQYKRMKLEKFEVKEKDDYDDYYEGEIDEDNNHTGHQQWVYRPEKNYYDEIERMHEFERICVSDENVNDINDYRYNSQVFYFKLCNAESVNLNSSEMIRGLYLPLEYWDRLLSSEFSTGPRGGKYIGYSNCGRHFNNSLFIDMVKSGWVGSRRVTSNQITKIINTVLTTGKSLVLAKFEKNK